MFCSAKMGSVYDAILSKATAVFWEVLKTSSSVHLAISLTHFS